MDFFAFAQSNKKLINDALTGFFINEINACKTNVRKRNIRFLQEYSLIGGKRLRPIAAILSYNAFDKHDSKILMPALATELLHTSTLIFDDIMDEDDYRRGQKGIQLKLKESKTAFDKKYNGNIFPSYTKKYAASMAILIGLNTEYYYRKLIYDSILSNDEKMACLRILDKAYKELICGQEQDIEFETTNPTEEEYLEMVKLKTAVLFAASLEIGAYLAGAKEKDCLLVKKYGELIATAFQIQDDLLDIDVGSKKGHEIGSDIKSGKKTLLYINTLNKTAEKDLSIIGKTFGNKDSTIKDIKDVILLYTNNGSIEHCKKKMSGLLKDGKEILNKLDIPNEKKLLIHDFSITLANREK
ncbi:MAG: polyprenyl synthetase family protein [archaeon]